MKDSNGEEKARDAGLRWLVRLRWLGLCTLLAVALLSAWLIGIRLPWAWIAVCVAIGSVLNLWATYGSSSPRQKIPTLLFGDLFLITVLLFFAGGSHNPFTGTYILLVALAATLLSPGAALLVLILSVLGFGLLFLSPYELESTLDDTCCTSFEAHLWGMVASLAVSGAGVVYFIQRLRRDEMHLRNLLEHARSVKRESDAHRNLAALAAGLAHELATPLGTIAVVAKDIEHAAASCGRLPMSSSASDARLILAEVGRCREVIERVASQSRSSGAEVPETIPLRDLPNLLVPFLAQQSLERVRWALPNSTAFLPKARFLQALAVLLKNAVEAGGEEQPVVHVTAQIAEKRLRIEVQDRGRGMPPEVLERLGEPFFSTKAEHGAGTGLGLFLCRVFCASVNGSLSFVSSPGKGTTAILDLPVDCAQPHVRSSHAPAS